MNYLKTKIMGLFAEKPVEDTFGIKFTNKALFALILPLVAEQFLGMLMGIVDTVMVSDLGDASVSGVSLVDMIFQLCFAVFSALATGGAVIASRYMGAKQPEEASKSACALLVISLIASLGVFAVVKIADVGLVRLLFGAIEQDVMDASLVYMRTISISFPAVALYSACAALFRSTGNSKISMYASAAVNLLNVAGNAICIYVLKLGVFGAGLSTVISRLALAIFFLIKIAGKKYDIHIDVRHLIKNRPRLPMYKSILSIGVPASLESGTFQLGRILVLSLISTFGTAQITANAVAGNIDAFGIITGHAFNLAIVTIIGQCVGCGDWKAVRFYTTKMIKLSYAMFIAFNAVLFAALPLILRMYSVSGEAMSIAVTLIIIHNGIGILLWTPSFVLPNAMKATGDAKFVMITAILSMFIFRVGLSQILGGYLGMGAVGVWWCMVIDWIARVICFGVRWMRFIRSKTSGADTSRDLSAPGNIKSIQ